MILAKIFKKNKKNNQDIKDIIAEAKKVGFSVKSQTDEKIYFEKGELCLEVYKNTPWIFYEVILKEGYKLGSSLIKAAEGYTVFDIGANRGYASVFLANNSWCKKVYSFEPNLEVFNDLCTNLKLNPTLKEKIVPFNVGLSDKTSIVNFFLFNGRDDLSTTSKDFIDDILGESKTKVITNSIVVNKASEILKSIIQNDNITDNIILKVDVEGSEYEIFKDLFENYPEIFKKTEFVLAEAHNTIIPTQDCLNFIVNGLEPYGFKLLDTEEFPEEKVINFKLGK